MNRRIRWSARCLLALWATSSAAWAADSGRFLAVDAGAPAASGDGSTARPFATIRAAIDKAVSGDTIKVAKGVYSENVVIDRKNLTLLGGFSSGDFAKSDPSSNRTVIQGNASAPTVQVKSAESGQIDGFKITGGLHGVELIGSKEIVISRNVVEGNGRLDGPTGGGIRFLDVRNITIRSNEIVKNKAGDGGGGIGYQRGKSVENLIIDGNHLAYNAAGGEHGGGAFIFGTGTVSNNHIEHNEASYGSGIFIDGGAFTCTNNIIHNNKSHGIFVIDYSHKGTELHHTLEHNLIYGNEFGFGTYWASLSIINCTMADNSAGAMDRRDDPKQIIEIKNSILWHNGLNPNGLNISYTLSEAPLPGTGNIKGDPLFASTDKNVPDYHLKSAAGRWDPKAKNEAGDWVTDAVTSPAIAVGDPSAEYTKQLKPSGGRIELGMYGNTPEASKSTK